MSFTINVPEDAGTTQTQSDLEPLPAGTYACTIFDATAEEVRSGPNAGKPRWNVQFRVAEGQYENRRLFAYIPLYVAGDFWKTQAFFTSLGYDVKGEFTVPDIRDVQGKAVDVKATVREAQGEYPASNNVAGFVKATSSTSSSESSDLWAE